MFPADHNHPQSRDGMNTHCVIECPNCVVEKTQSSIGTLGRSFKTGLEMFDLLHESLDFEEGICYSLDDGKARLSE
jgi:hypothetical protein